MEDYMDHFSPVDAQMGIDVDPHSDDAPPILREQSWTRQTVSRFEPEHRTDGQNWKQLTPNINRIIANIVFFAWVILGALLFFVFMYFIRP